MTKRKTKRNAGTSQARHGFKIRKNPVVYAGSIPNGHDRVGSGRVLEERLLFAIARDARTIFTSWNIDWRSIFKKATPADRQVHLRLIGADGVIEAKAAVEPMIATHYFATSGLQNAYRVEIGYFQPLDTWNSVAMSVVVEMPPQGSVELTDVNLATIPFHLNFQKLADLFAQPNDTSVARLVSDFQNRILASDQSNEVTTSEKRILHDLELSLPEIAAAQRKIRRIDSEKLGRRVRGMFPVFATSPTRGFQADPS